MDIISLGNRALQDLRKYPNFPKSGFIAGGSISNLIWEYVSGNKAIINDIDVFIFETYIEKLDTSNWIEVGPKKELKKLSYNKVDIVYAEGYNGMMSVRHKSNEFYFVNRTEYKGIFNFTYYSSNKTSPQLIINSFDINCTQMGYSIEEDKFYWTKEFEDFLMTGNIQLCNLSSPAHSAIRLAKKKKDLNAELDPMELKLCQYAIACQFCDIIRRYFTQKYIDRFKDNFETLGKYFDVKSEQDASDTLMSKKNIRLDMFSLVSKEESKNIFDNNFGINQIYTGEKLLYYMRNVIGNNDRMLLWSKLHYIMNNDEYLDSKFNESDVEMLHTLIMTAPNTIKNLKGLSLQNQLSIVNLLFDRYKEDPIIAISILEKIKLDPNKEFDEDDFLLLELSVRKEILGDIHNKVDRILNPKQSKVEKIFDDGDDGVWL